MKGRILGGILIMILGIILIVPVFFGLGFVSWIYGWPIFIIGLVIIFNSNEDKIEKIKISNKKGGKNNE